MRLDSLVLIEGSFIDEELRESSADLLFSIALRSGGSAFVYVLFEHQSTHDERMPFSSVLSVDDRQRAAFGGKLLGFDFVLDDLAQQTDAEILDRASDAVVRLTLLSLRNGRSHPRLFELVATAMRTLQAELRGPAVATALARLARYAFDVGEVPSAVSRAAFATALDPVNRSAVMATVADFLRAEARRETLLDLLDVKFGRVDAATRKRIDEASNEQVVAWIRRAAVVTALEAVFAT